MSDSVKANQTKAGAATEIKLGESTVGVDSTVGLDSTKVTPEPSQPVTPASDTLRTGSDSTAK
jgi:hypothetical protein